MNFEHGRCNTDSCDAGCPGKRDVLFVMHSSTGMRDSYDQIKNFFYDIVKQINIDPSPETIRFRNRVLKLFSHSGFSKTLTSGRFPVVKIKNMVNQKV